MTGKILVADDVAKNVKLLADLLAECDTAAAGGTDRTGAASRCDSKRIYSPPTPGCRRTRADVGVRH